MALIYFEGWEQYSSGGEAIAGHTPWYSGYNSLDTTGTIDSDGARGDGKGLQISSSYDDWWPYFTWKNPSPGVSLCLGYAHKGGNIVEIKSNFLAFCADDKDNHHFMLKVNTDMKLQLYTDAGGSVTPVAETSSTLPINMWQYLEVRATVNTVSGNIVVKLYGDTILTYNGNTAHSSSSDNKVYYVSYGGYRCGDINNFDDMYFCDLSGTVNNDFMGDVYVRGYVPDADGSLNDFTSSDAPTITTRYTQVDEGAPNDGDSTYVDSDTNGDQQSFDYPNAATLGDIAGVMSFTYARKDGLGSMSLKQLCKSGTTVDVTDAQSLTIEYNPTWGLWNTNPDTGSAWNIAAVNAAEFGFETVK